jgi:outer membrane protein TolC
MSRNRAPPWPVPDLPCWGRKPLCVVQKLSIVNWLGSRLRRLISPKNCHVCRALSTKAIQTARRENPDLKNAQEMSRSGKFTSYSTVGSVLPSVNLTGTYSRNEDPTSLLVGSESEVTRVEVRLSCAALSRR